MFNQKKFVEDLNDIATGLIMIRSGLTKEVIYRAKKGRMKLKTYITLCNALKKKPIDYFI